MENNFNLPKIGFTLGDINGIGPEIILKTLNESSLLNYFVPIIFGSTKVLNFYKNLINDCNVNLVGIKSIEQARHKQINVINCWEEQINILPGQITSEGGKYAAISLLQASQALKEKNIDAMVTAPIHKKNIMSNAFNFVGHTPFLQNFFGVPDVVMLMISESMRVALLTEHLPLKDVASKLNTQLIINKTILLNKILQEDFLISKPRIAILGANPHNGDEGLVGREEIESIAPAIKQLNVQNILAFGPYSADGFFARGNEKKFDAIMAMYHDQGLIPFKSLSIGDGTNYTGGLGVVRTSPDHGTGFDIAGKNLADESSFRAAIFKAIEILKNKKEFKEYNANKLTKQVIKEVKNYEGSKEM